MSAAQGGDQTAYSALLKNCVPIIKAVARRSGATMDCVDDVVQETLITLHRARHTYDPGRPFIAWLSVLAQRRAVDVLRRQGRSRTREVHAPIAYENYPTADQTPEQRLEDDHTGVGCERLTFLELDIRNGVDTGLDFCFAGFHR